MKRTIYIFTVLVVLSSGSWAQTWGPQAPGQVPGQMPGQQPMFPQRTPYGVTPSGMPGSSMANDAMNQIMLQRIEACRSVVSNQGTELQEMMQLMKDMMRIQERILTGASDEEKKKITEELAQMTGKLDKMTTDLQAMLKKSGLAAQPAPPEPAKTKAAPKPKKEEPRKAESKKNNKN
jgi:hypothetical protein